MDDRGANIDLLFRNGLRDYEVLPPAEVWDKIQPVVRRKTPLFFRRFLKAAAMTTTVTTISIVAWMMSRDNAMETFGPAAGFNIVQSDPLRNFSGGAPAIRLKEASYALMVDTGEADFASFDYPDDPGTVPEPGFGKLNIPGPGFLTGGTPLLASGLNESSSKPEGNPLYQDFEVVVPGYTAPQATQAEKWSISALASPTYYSKFTSEASDPATIAAEDYAPSYSGGLAVAYKINKRLSIQTGVYYASHGQHLDGINSFSGFQPFVKAKGGHYFELATSSGTVIANNADVFLAAEGAGEMIRTQYTSDVFDPVKASLTYIDNSLVQNFRYLQMPVMLRYKLVDRNLDFNIVGGLASDFLIGNSAYALEGGSRYRIGETAGVRSLAFSSSLGMGMEYNFSGRLSLNLEPTFRYFINPFSSQTGPRIYPYSFGVFSGVSYRF